MSIIRDFETLLGEVEDVEIIRDKRDKSLFVAIAGRTIAKRTEAGWALVQQGRMDPQWMSLETVFTEALPDMPGGEE